MALHFECPEWEQAEANECDRRIEEIEKSLVDWRLRSPLLQDDLEEIARLEEMRTECILERNKCIRKLRELGFESPINVEQFLKS